MRNYLIEDIILEHVGTWTPRTSEHIYRSVLDDYGTTSKTTVSYHIRRLVKDNRLTRICVGKPYTAYLLAYSPRLKSEHARNEVEAEMRDGDEWCSEVMGQRKRA